MDRGTGWIGDSGASVWLTGLRVSCLDPWGSSSASSAGTSHPVVGGERRSRRECGDSAAPAPRSCSSWISRRAASCSARSAARRRRRSPYTRSSLIAFSTPVQLVLRNVLGHAVGHQVPDLSLIHISEPTRLG